METTALKQRVLELPGVVQTSPGSFFVGRTPFLRLADQGVADVRLSVPELAAMRPELEADDRVTFGRPGWIAFRYGPADHDDLMALIAAAVEIWTSMDTSHETADIALAPVAMPGTVMVAIVMQVINALIGIAVLMAGSPLGVLGLVNAAAAFGLYKLRLWAWFLTLAIATLDLFLHLAAGKILYVSTSLVAGACLLSRSARIAFRADEPR